MCMVVNKTDAPTQIVGEDKAYSSLLDGDCSSRRRIAVYLYYNTASVAVDNTALPLVLAV